MKQKKNDEFLNSFSKGLEHFMKRCSISEKQIAECCGVSVPMVSNWLKSRNLPTFPSLQKLYNLGMNVTEIFSIPKGIDDEKFFSNQNMIDYDDLRCEFLNPLIRMRLFTMIEKRNNVFDNQTKAEKLDFLFKAIDVKLEELSKLNTLLFNVSCEK